MSARIELQRIPVNGVGLNVATAGDGPTVVLLHGFPHTWEVWRKVIDGLAGRHRVIAPDLRGFGASGHGETGHTGAGYDAGSLAEDVVALLDALGEGSAAVVGIDAGVAPAFLAAMRRPDRVSRLVLMEALLGRLPGADGFLADGAPWWFGFHAVPGLAENVLAGNEATYVDWFLNAGTRGRGVEPAIRDAFVSAYAGRGALARAFSYYRALPESAAQIEQAVAAGRLLPPTLAIGAHPVGRALERQLDAVACELTGRLLEDCGHIIPLDRPAELLALLEPFLRGAPLPEAVPLLREADSSGLMADQAPR
jgi:pimeloyl-ACP methyl ester carboxylesterase